MSFRMGTCSESASWAIRIVYKELQRWGPKPPRTPPLPPGLLCSAGSACSQLLGTDSWTFLAAYFLGQGQVHIPFRVRPLGRTSPEPLMGPPPAPLASPGHSCSLPSPVPLRPNGDVQKCFPPSEPCVPVLPEFSQIQCPPLLSSPYKLFPL